MEAPEAGSRASSRSVRRMALPVLLSRPARTRIVPLAKRVAVCSARGPRRRAGARKERILRVRRMGGLGLDEAILPAGRAMDKPAVSSGERRVEGIGDGEWGMGNQEWWMGG